jgi:[ribosomal protein S5]-alanine N-acetyltransferase
MDGVTFEISPILKTERLLLRGFVSTDAPAVLVFRGDPHVQRFNSEPLRNANQALAFIEELRTEQAAGRSISWAISLGEGEPAIGSVGLYHWNEYHSRAELGYDLARSYWGRGIGSEAASSVVQFGFGQLGLHRIEAATIADNHESVRLLRKLGFQLEGMRREYSWEEDGRFHDSAMYGLLEDQWPSSGNDEPTQGLLVETCVPTARSSSETCR